MTMGGTALIVLVVALGLGGLGLVLLLGAVGLYNGLVRLRGESKNAWSQIDVQLKRRHDLLPNLVETVKGYAKHEEKTLQGVIAARQQAMTATSIEDRMKAEVALGGAVRGLFGLVESYPDLKANANFLKLQEELTSTENKIGFSRQYYNDATTQYNTKLELFPSNLVASMFGFKASPLFQINDEKERDVPKVSFS
jgi:LemA protein